ncbi:MAG TPA: cytochrome c biogenesis protein CcdA, partial [Stenomitos sp.]
MSSFTPSLGLAFAGGLLTVLSPCILPILPLLLGRSLQSHRFGPVMLVVGLVAGFAFAGSLLGIVTQGIPALANHLRTIAVTLLIGLGVLTCLPKLAYRLSSLLPTGFATRASIPLGLAGEFWLGTQLGILWTPCAGPVLGAILVLAAVQHDGVNAFKLLTTYGMGAAVPLLMLAYAGRRLARSMTQLRIYG